MARISHATKNEMGMISGGAYGDQTGVEVVIQDFFEYDWEYNFRPKNKTLADRLATNAEVIAKNDNIGYGQAERYTMYLEARKLNWDFAKIDKPCATDCSQMIATDCIAEGLNVSPYMYTGNEKGELMKTGAFEVIPYEMGMRLERGDILLTTKRGHTCIVVDGSFPNHTPKWTGECYGAATVPVYKEPNEKSEKCSWPYLGTGNMFDVCDEKDDWYFIRIASVYFGWIKKQFVLRKTKYTTGVVTSDVYLRANAGANYKKLAVLKTGQELDICDVKKAANKADWYYISTEEYGFGFCSAKYVSVK